MPDQTIIVPLPGYAITLTLGPPNQDGERHGRIESDMAERFGAEDDPESQCVCEVVERIILAQALAGIDVTTPAYVDAILTVLETYAEELG